MFEMFALFAQFCILLDCNDQQVIFIAAKPPNTSMLDLLPFGNFSFLVFHDTDMCRDFLTSVGYSTVWVRFAVVTALP